MLNKIHMIKISALLLIIVMATVACGGGSGLTTEQQVALTVAASNVPPTLSVDQIVALTVAASAPVAPAGPDVADPNSAIQPIQPVADPNLASGTPQLRANLNSNVRSGPGTNYRVISSLLTGSVVTVIAKNGDGTWFLIELPGGSTGWIANSVTDPVNAADMGKVGFAATIPAPPPPAATATATTTTAVAATHTPQATTAGATVAPTATATMPPMPTQLTKSNWQVDLLFLGGSDRLQVVFNQAGSVLSGSNRDNNAELDIVTTGTVTGDTVVITFTLSNGSSPRGIVTCTGTIDAGPPQRISGTFVADDGTDGTCDFR